MSSLTVALLLATAAHQQGPPRPDTIPPDTYADAGARALVERAMAARDHEKEGVESYEGVLRERLYLGFAGLNFRRERSLFQSERIARIRWSRTEGKAIQWIGSRDEVPMLGPDGWVQYKRSSGEGEDDGSINIGLQSEDAPEELRVNLQNALLQNLNPMVFSYRPGDDRLVFGEAFALHPLADSAAFHYRYRTGDTLRIDLPSEDRVVTLVEVLLEPRRADYKLLAGSLWFEAETGALARATYRPARPYDLALDGPNDDLPGIFSPVHVDFDYFTMEYSLHDLRWWLPRRFGLEGEIRVGKLLRIPAAVEWSVSEYLVNTDETLIPSDDELPEGWASQVGEVVEEGRDPEQVRIVVPPGDSVRYAPQLSGEMLGPSPIAFTDDEINELRGKLEGLIPGYRLFQPQVAYGFADRNLRYNRVEGISLGASATVPLSPTYSLEPRFRIGLMDQAPRGSLSLHSGLEEDRISLTAFRRLAHTSDFGNPLSLGTSLSNLLFRNAHSNFYQATGAELGIQRLGRRTRFNWRLFWEDHQAVARETNFYLWRPLTGDTLPLNLTAQEGQVTGLSGDLRWQVGVDPSRAVLSGLLRGEFGEGDFSYQRALASLAFSRPLALGTAVALEVGAGGGWGELPLQKNFFLGGSSTLRGYPGSYAGGESFWMARGELGTSVPLARLALFSDLGWAGSRADFLKREALWSLGGGISLMDGLVRMDFAWPLREASGMRFYLYMDGLF